MKNRYGDEYFFKQLTEDTYTIEGDLKYWRSGYNEDGSISFVDPSGGPFIDIGYPINNKVVSNITIKYDNDQIIFTVKDRT
jgi:hypothetical protein